MNKYTVIGFYTDTGLRYVGHTEAEDVPEAIGHTIAMCDDESISIVAVIAGHHNDLMEGDYLEDSDDFLTVEE